MSQNTTNREYYRPLFELHHVTLVLQGHAHGYELRGLMGGVDANIDRAECAMRRLASGPVP